MSSIKVKVKNPQCKDIKVKDPQVKDAKHPYIEDSSPLSLP
uniref:Uncharacterized protein n=1 Tax=Moniliophthora roreri TaxID=221103 RepID=A0A0W0F620_MONRR